MSRRPYGQYRAYDTRIKAMVDEGRLHKDIAVSLKIPLHAVYGAKRRMKNPNYQQNKTKPESGFRRRAWDALTVAVDTFTHVAVEIGASGGYICTLDELYTGREEETPVKAIKSAMLRAEGAGNGAAS
jgi:hypothetical protein